MGSLESLRTNNVPNKRIPPSVWMDHYKNLLTEDRPEVMTENNGENDSQDQSFTEELQKKKLGKL